MASKGYVVSEGSFAYDDNYYSSEEGVHPTKIFLDKDQAQEYADDLGIKLFKSLVLDNEIFNYGYGDLDGVFNESDEFDDFIKEKFGFNSHKWWKNRSNTIVVLNQEDEEEEKDVEFSEEDWKKFYSFSNLPLVDVMEVEFGDVFS